MNTMNAQNAYNGFVEHEVLT